jgi:predicted deacetylase
MVIHVSIHDVCPRHSAEVEHAILLCRAREVAPALLVVPDMHGEAPLDRDPAFVARLLELERAGSQILLHGLYHLTERAPGTARWGSCGGLSRYFRQRVASAGEAEFGELTFAEASERLDRGLAMFSRLGLPVHGFVPPAWILPRRLMPALAARDIRYTESHFGVHDPVTGRSRTSAVMNFATRTHARLLTSVSYVRAARAFRRALPLRIAIHPADLRSPLALRETIRLLDWARGDFVHRVEDLFQGAA